MLRKAIFVFFLLIGVGCGLLATRDDDWGMRIVMMAIGAMAGSAIGGALSQIGKPLRRLPLATDEEAGPFPASLGTSSRDRAANFWRDEGHMPFMKPPPPPQPDHGMFDPDKDS
ncbi:hypothetical protein [Piscinibacter sakaiensis]|uniref:hypothetical protein n=1 Tax=Piscinibacter sakaiensis TaxID=1547922 RepID=UPI003AAC30A8